MLQNEQLSVITPIPDDNTSESIMYGSAYLFAKSSKNYWDSMEDYTRREIETLKYKIKNPEFCAWVLRCNKNLIYTDNPPVDTIDKIRDLHTLKEIIKRGTAIREIDIRRTENLMYSQLIGISEYSSKMLENGISDKTWKSATIGYDTPIEYETIRAKRDEDEKQAIYDAQEYQQANSEFKTCQKQLTEQYNEYIRQRKETKELEDVESEEIQPFSILKEIFEDEKEDDDYTRLLKLFTKWSYDPIDEMITWINEQLSNKTNETDESREIFENTDKDIPEQIWESEIADPQNSERVGLLKILFKNRKNGGTA